MPGMAASASSVFVPVTASPAATTTPRGFAVVVPVKNSVFVGAVTAVIIAGHIQTAFTVILLLRIQPVVQTAGFQVVPIIGLVVTGSPSGSIFSITAK